MTHVKNGEETDLRLEGGFVFDLKVKEVTVPIPPIKPNKSLQTNLLERIKTPGRTSRIIKSFSASWGNVDPEKSEVLIDIVLKNPENATLIVKNLKTDIYMNNIKMVKVQPEGEIKIQPNKESEISFKAVMDNEQIPK